MYRNWVSLRNFSLFVAVFTLVGTLALAQSTGSVQGTVTDASGAVVPNAQITIHGTGVDRTVTSDSAGLYLVASLPVGSYTVQVKATGFQTMKATDVVLEVGRALTQDFALKVSSTSETVEVNASAAVVEAGTVSIGSVVNQKTVQEIPLNGRHFVDLALLTVGTVTPPANGFLTAPLRGQGSFAFNTAGAREDQVNYMINGINMSDPVQNQITFQPTINTVQEFKVDNSTYNAEYGRNAGAIVNIATRSGTNVWHGEVYDFLRNNDLDARNFTNPTNTGSGATLTPNPQSPFKRNQFGGDGGGFLIKDKTFFFGSYEGLRQRQAVPLSATVLSDAQRAQVLGTSDPIVKRLLPLIPAANSGISTFIGAATANVDIDQGTGNLSHNFTDKNRLNVYFALQHDLRGEPPTTQGNNLPGYGDHREARRQIFTFNDTQVFNSNWVNEARLGYNRIHITFNPNNLLNAADFGINSGVNAPIGLPQINVTGGPVFGGINGFPQGRGDYSAASSDTVSWVHGKHNIRFGGEYRRIDNNNFSYTPGTFGFASIATFMADQANSFAVTSSNRSNRVFVNSIGAFVTDSYKVSSRLLLDLGLRWDWFGTPTEGGGRFVEFIPSTASLVQLGTNGAPSTPYNQNFRLQPRLGFAYDLFGNGRTIVRSAYAIMADQPITGIVTGLATNPPFAFPISSTAAGLSLANAFTLAGGSVSPTSIGHNYKDAYVQSWNFNIQEKLSHDFGMMVGYYASKGTDLNIARNYNQFVNGARPFATLSAASPILPGKPLTNISVQESVGNSSYNGLWATLTKHFGNGLQFNASYTFSKSIDDVSRNNEGVVVQDSNNLRGDRGLSDFDARQRFTISGIYELPFKANRFVRGWQLSTVIQTQTGNPINFHTTTTGFTGNGNLRPSVTGPVQTGFSPATDRVATHVTYLQNPGVFVNPGNAFGNLGRNVFIGPGFTNVDFALVKNTRITERLNYQIRVDAFDLFNKANFSQPGPSAIADTLGSATFNMVQGTRFPAGDFGTSRQIQIAMKLQF